ncbi:MAG: nitroreductase family protein, partial [Candidatus Caldarchaeum sp.]|nr:nitroreductase family protein [Candidatus Caldarchaeum sp.]MDW8435913.1 nitroreductase family protein [Candidatus Caldarchaeum sp.]
MNPEELLSVIYSKRETREFFDKPVQEETVFKILEAGRLAGSAKNRQPWVFILVRNKANLSQLSKYGHFAQHLPQAAFAVVIAVRDTYFQDRFDAGRAAQNMMLAAHSLGIGSCPITLHDEERAKKHLNLPDNMRIAICIAFGYPVPVKRKGKVIRKPINQILYNEKYATS